jgi:hypothetical protein
VSDLSERVSVAADALDPSTRRKRGARQRTVSLVLRVLVLALTFVALLVVAYRSRMDWRSPARGARELLSSSADPVKFTLPEDKARTPRDAVTVAVLSIPPPPVSFHAGDSDRSLAAPQGHTPGHRLRGPPNRLS